MGGGSSKGVLLVSWTCVLPADLGGGRGSVSLHRDEGIGSPPRAGGVSAVCRAGRGCECCIGRFLEKGVARTQSRSCAEIGGDLDKQNEKTSPAPTLRSKDSRNTDWQRLDVRLPLLHRLAFEVPERSSGRRERSLGRGAPPGLDLDFGISLAAWFPGLTLCPLSVFIYILG